MAIEPLLWELPAEVRFVLGNQHYNAPNVRQVCQHTGRNLVTPQPGPYPHSDPGVEVRRIFHELRSRAIENFNGQFKGIFDIHGQVPTKGLINTRRFALGAILVYQLALLTALSMACTCELEGINVWSLYDCGAAVQNIMLLATSYGLGTVAQAQAVVYPDIIRKVLGIPESKLIAQGIAIGYPD